MSQPSVTITITGQDVIGTRAVAYAMQRLLQSFNIPVSTADTSEVNTDVNLYPIAYLGVLSLMREQHIPVHLQIG